MQRSKSNSLQVNLAVRKGGGGRQGGEKEGGREGRKEDEGGEGGREGESE